MANRYWVGGNANWDATAGTKWATTSGGAGGAAVPTAADDVFLDNGAGTGNVTIPTATTVTCRSLNCTGYIKTLTFSTATSNINIGDGTAGAGNVALTFVSGMTLTLTGVGTITLKSTSATQQTVTGGGKTLPNITVNGTGSSYIAGDALVGGTTSTFLLTAGTWDNGGYSSSYGTWNISGSTARTWKMSGSALTISGTGSGTFWNAATTTNLTASDLASSGSLTATGAGTILGVPVFNGGALTYNSLTLNSSFGIYQISSANSFVTLSITSGATTVNELRLNANQTVTGTCTLNGNSVTNRLLVRSATIGTKRTLTVATLSSNNFLDFMDITAAGASSPWSNTSWGILNVTSITGATPVNTYWVGGTGNSNDATKYASSSGGTANTQRAPLLQDTAYYDANSGTGTLTISGFTFGTLNFTSTALTGITWNGGFAQQYIAGSFIGNSSCLITCGGFGNSVVFCSDSTVTLSMPGTTWTTHNFAINGLGTFNQGSDLNFSAVAFSQTLATFNTNGYLIKAASFTWTSGTTNCGASTFMIMTSSAGTVWTGSNTWNAGTSVIDWTSASASNQTFAGGAKTYYNLIVNTGGAGTKTITGSNTWQGLQAYGGSTKTIRFTSGTTQTLNSNFFFSGFAGNLITVNAVTAASAFTLTSPVKITTNFIALQDCTAAGTGNPFFAGANSTNTSGNTNWTFSSAIQRSNKF